MSVIIAEQLSKQFPGESHLAVDHVTFSINAGECVVLLGPSGCGKTTLLKMINRLYEPTSGHLHIDGQNARSISPTMLRRRIGYAIQQTGLFPHLRIEQNIAIVPRLLGWKPARTETRIDELLELVGLPHAYRKRYPRQLSGGEQQRVGLARALAADPTIMLMDEPFGALDAITRTRLQDELINIQHKLHKTILFVTHDVDEALRLADRIIIMRAGQIVQFDTPLTLLTQPIDPFVEQLLGSEDVLRHLSLMQVVDLLHRPSNKIGPPHPPAHLPTLNPHDTLRTALIQLLHSGAETLPIVDKGQKIGQCNLTDIRATVHRPPTEPKLPPHIIE